MKSSDAVVIGGGVIGCSVAYHLAKRGIDVILVEKDDIASGTSGACDKAALLQSKNPGLHLEMALESVKLFPELQRELDTDIEFKNNGGMIVIKTDEQWQVMQGFVEGRGKQVSRWNFWAGNRHSRDSRHLHGTYWAQLTARWMAK